MENNKQPILQRLYYRLTWSLQNHVLSVLVGAASGVALNLLTGPDTGIKVWGAFVCFLLVVIALVILNNIRQYIDLNLASRTDMKGTQDQKWEAAADYTKKERRRAFFGSFLVVLIAIGVGSWCMYSTNKENKRQKQDLVAAQAARITWLQADSAALQQIISHQPTGTPAGNKQPVDTARTTAVPANKNARP